MVIMLREVRQHYIGCMAIIPGGKEFSELLIRQMSRRTTHALLHRPWIRPVAQHFKVVVRLDDQHIASPQIIFYVGQKPAQISGDCDFDTFRQKGKTYRIDCIVWNGEWRDCNIADAKAVT